MKKSFIVLAIISYLLVGFFSNRYASLQKIQREPEIYHDYSNFVVSDIIFSPFWPFFLLGNLSNFHNIYGR